jgi:hypothetical protein
MKLQYIFIDDDRKKDKPMPIASQTKPTPCKSQIAFENQVA